MPGSPVKQIPAVILAGGEGRRMGSIDKCLIDIHKKSVLDHLIVRLRAQNSPILLSANGDLTRFASFAITTIPDRYCPTVGPLGGIVSVFEYLQNSQADSRWLLSVPGDCPFIPFDMCDKLAAEAIPPCQVVYASSKGRDHFTAALWSAQIMPELKKFIARGGRSVGAFIAEQNHKSVVFSDAIDPFFNINTQDQWLEARKLARRIFEE